MPKTTPKTSAKRVFVVNSLGAVFYLLCTIQWVWASAPYLPSLVTLLDAINRPYETTSQPSAELASYSFGASLPPTIILVIGAIVLVLTIAILVYLVLTIPKTVGKTGHSVTQSTSKKIATATPKFKQLAPKQRRKLTARILLYVKLGFVVLPVALSALSFTVAQFIPHEAVILSAALLAILSALALLGQVLASKFLHVPFEKSW